MRRMRGMTLIELLVVLAITAILLTLAVPSFTDQMARRRLEGVATDLSADLQFARSQAVNDRATVRIITETGGSQYRIVNAAGTTLKTVVFPAGITSTDAVTVDYEQLRGGATVVNGPINISSTRTAATMRVNVSATGRVSLCSPLATYLRGYTQCS